MTPHYNDTFPWILLLNQWRENTSEDEIAKPGQIICAVDETAPLPPNAQRQNDQMSTARHEELISRQVIYMQIATFHFNKCPLNLTCDSVASVCALLLEPTGQNADEYRRVGFAEIPTEISTGEGWEEKTITVI
jgi:hypothetical protein